ASHNVSLGKFTLTDIPPLPKGGAKIEVKFSVDANGMLEVLATDVYTEHAQAITVKSNRLADNDIKRMADEAATCKTNDHMACERIKTRIAADDVINAAVETLPKITVKKIPTGRIDDAIAKSRHLLENGDVDELEASIQHLKDLMNDVVARS
ncbi:MAG: hypothetical protein COS89_03750, partial [Deltaproteobacteria bacterium CG07_land_8_20_14_0_80_38_7]